ncbi:MAG: hypothetical protein RLZZ138_222 [Actinomycetota bacterium]|jgi:hypothetical protein
MRLAATALLSAVLVFAAQWYYQPSVETSVVATLVSLLLLGVITWSATRLGYGFSGFAKVLVVGIVSGLMFSQAMDVSYSILAAPAGGRLGFPFEMLVVGFALALLAKLLAHSIRAKVEKQPDRD